MNNDPLKHNGAISEALKRDKTVDISTLGRRSGKWRRIEIWYHRIDGRIYITAIPRPRGWFANLLVNPVFQFHLKESVEADLQVRARPILDAVERQEILSSEQLAWYHQRSESQAAFIRDAPLVEVLFS